MHAASCACRYVHGYDHLGKGRLGLTVSTARVSVILIIGAIGVSWAAKRTTVIPLLIARRLANQKLSLVSNHELLVIVAHVVPQLAAHVAPASTATMVILTPATVATALARLILEHIVRLGCCSATDGFVHGRWRQRLNSHAGVRVGHLYQTLPT